MSRMAAICHNVLELMIPQDTLSYVTFFLVVWWLWVSQVSVRVRMFGIH